ncbi:MAG: hypothetical protein K0Q92_3282 [Steroidobacteraceae bacterium]|nr:hypothetical protein [Steroidobacteraceae bacterium]
MSSTASSRTSNSRALLLAASLVIAGCTTSPPGAGVELFADDFSSLDNWVLESERPATVVVKDGAVDIDTPAGLTLWFKPRLTGPVEIEFDAIAVSDGGANDQVSDLNVFWMASNRDGSAPFPGQRSGRFADYNDLLTYYVGLGGNRNSTTRFRRYIGDPVQRPLLPEHDLSAPDFMLVPNQKQTIILKADRTAIEFKRDGRALFRFEDAEPYTQGWFAIRTTWSHLRISRLRIRSLAP